MRFLKLGYRRNLWLYFPPGRKGDQYEANLFLMFALLVTGFVRGDAGIRHEQDPITVNSGTIGLKLENSRVRVLEATLKPGDKEKTHSHPAYVIYVIEGGKVRMHGADGNVTETEFRAGDAIYRGAVTHWAENIGTTTIHLVLVELKN